MLLLLCGTFVACETDDETLALTEDESIEFQGNSAVVKSKDLSNLRFKDVPGSIALDESTPEGEIHIEASEPLDDKLEVKTEGGELRIVGKGDIDDDDLTFYIHPHDIRKIVVEGDNKVEIHSTPVLEYLELVTEGESQLVIHHLRARHLVSKREGKSRMYLSSERADFDRTSFPFLASSVQVLDDHYLIYRENDFDYLLYAPQFTYRNDSVIAIGSAANPLRPFFITHTHELRNEGESYLDALELPTFAVASRNEGKSESKVWAMRELDVKGEGESIMYYRGNPDVDQRLEGSARLIKLP